MADKDLIDRLRRKRNDYGDEICWHRFLLDAYTGTGGFGGRIKQPSTAFLGWAATAYSDSVVHRHSNGQKFSTYLDRFPREDDAKFRRRIDVAHYPNFAEMVLDMLVSFIIKRGLSRAHLPKQLEEWMSDIDGDGTSWDGLIAETQVVRSALLGWMPMLFDAPPAPDELIEGGNRAQTDEAGLNPQPIPLYPANVLDWQFDKGAFQWVKIRLDYTEQEDPLGSVTEIEEYQIWHRDSVHKYIVKKTDEREVIDDLGESINPLGVVPLVIWKHKASPECRVRGLGMLDGIAPLIRRLFNLVSELDEHIRQNVFPLLLYPQNTNAADKDGELVVGSDNALVVAEKGNVPQYIAPPASVADTLETRIANTIATIFWLARLERQDGSKQVQSGISKAYDFEKTNRRLGDFAAQIAKADRASLVLVAKMLNLGEQEINEISVTPPVDFRIEDLASDLANAMSALELNLPPTVEYLIKQRVIKKMLPSVSADERAIVEAELAKQRDEQLQTVAENREFGAGEDDDES